MLMVLCVAVVLLLAAALYHEVERRKPVADESGLVTGEALPLTVVDVKRVVAIEGEHAGRR
jgi:hypothetical protein